MSQWVEKSFYLKNVHDHNALFVQTHLHRFKDKAAFFWLQV